MTTTEPKRPRGRPRTLSPEDRRIKVRLSLSRAEIDAVLRAGRSDSITEAVRRLAGLCK